ncbi:MAG TPA: MAPEG family protein [Steroidobacteraceae bacterium]|nr:MAPEG family protein [Steroidobacteraceae bacterium]
MLVFAFAAEMRQGIDARVNEIETLGTHMNVYLICSAILVLMYFALALNVSLTRGRVKIGIGSGPDPSGPLNKAVRTHGNAGEFIPIFVTLFLFFLITGAGGWIDWVVVIATASRILHAIGMLATTNFNQGPHILRAIGALGTYLSGVALGIALLMRVFA